MTAPAAAAASKLTSPESYTPRHLAEKILTSKAALEGERKQVTVLFADLKGSMELLADRDPEEARHLLDPVLERMMEAVHRYEGTVNQVMGDGIMALFEAPLAHEDHGVRACYAAFDMQTAIRQYADEVWRAHGVKAEIRVGLNSGVVVVRTIGSDLHGLWMGHSFAVRGDQTLRPKGHAARRGARCRADPWVTRPTAAAAFRWALTECSRTRSTRRSIAGPAPQGYHCRAPTSAGVLALTGAVPRRAGMKLKRHWPIVAALIAIVMLLVVWLRAPGPHVPVPLETNEGSSTIETALVASVVEPSKLPTGQDLADKPTNARRVTLRTRKVRDAADASRHAYVELWCAGAYEPARGTNFEACP
ncbi:MAG: adenylate/guanylate cyclase domain-containing protein [Candidatus Rokuibacteriota bacterium]